MKKSLFMLVLLMFFGLVSSATAATWYVKTDGLDTNSGQSWDQAFATIQNAIDTATENVDEIWVKQGTYTLTAQINVDKAVDIYGGFLGLGDQREWYDTVTTVDGNHTFRCFLVTADAIIDGFKIINGNAMVRGGGIWNRNCSPKIQNCIFIGNEAAAGGGICNRADTVVQTPLIVNCIFYNNAAAYGGAIANELSYSQGSVVNCTVLNNAATHGGGIRTMDDIAITNCLVGENTPNQIEGNATVTYCSVQGGFPGEGNMDEDPLLVDPENGDFHLGFGSPVIDKGNNNAIPPGITTDFYGDDRIINGAGDAIVDMGADEYYPAAAGIPTMTGWGMIILSMLLFGAALWFMRKRMNSDSIS